MSGWGDYSGQNQRSYDRYMQHNANSTTHKLKNVYWTTKQAIGKKLGKKEDEHIVACDSELDSKLELFKSIQTTSNDISRFTSKYMECICALSQAENEMGRFLKQYSQIDHTKAGEMMSMTGKALSFSAQKRLALRASLQRLGQEVDTFRLRAIGDTSNTIQSMESKRTDYRGALMWMKQASEELDPDTFKQLEKFRKVQAQVKKAKDSFDKIKIDSMQKIDLLAASRSNMLSHVLVAYQAALLEFWAKTEESMSDIAEKFKGYQYYEFSMLKELNIENRKLAIDDDDEEIADIGEEVQEKGLESKEQSLLDIFSSDASSSHNQDLMNNDEMPKEEKDFLMDIFSTGEQSSNTNDTNTEMISWTSQPAAFTWNSLATGQSTSLQPSVPVQSHDMLANPNKNQQEPNNMNTWMNLFSDLGPMDNPDLLSKKADEIENL